MMNMNDDSIWYALYKKCPDIVMKKKKLNKKKSCGSANMKEKNKTKKPRKLYYTEKPSRLPGCKMSCGVTLSNLMTFFEWIFHDV